MEEASTTTLAQGAGTEAGREWMRAIRQRWWWLVGLSLLGAAIAAFAQTRWPKRYEARATLEYDPTGSAPAEGSSGLAYLSSRQQLQTQNFILKSRSVAERAVRKLSLDQASPPDSHASAAQRRSAFQRAVQDVQDSVEVVAIPATRIVSVRVRANEPRRAAQIANAVVDAYLEKSLEDRVGESSRALEWLRGEQTELKREVEASELAVFKFREEHQALAESLTERRKVISSEIQSYSDALTDLRIKRIEAQARLAVLKEAIAGEPDPLVVQAGPIASAPAIVALRERYRIAETELKQLTTTYPPESQQVVAMQARRDTLHNQLKLEFEAVLKGAHSDLKEVEKTETGLQQELAQVRKRSVELSREEMEFARLEREMAGRTERYSLVLERMAQTDLSRAMGAVTARVLDRAEPPATPVGPTLAVAVPTGGGVGMLLGALVATALAHGRKRPGTD